MAHCFAPLLGWVITEWQGTQIALALDASSLGMRFVVLALSVVYRGCAIPVAWIVLPAAKRRAWRPEWLRLLRRVHRVIPKEWTVIVLADRGLYARWLYRRIVRLGWHPFLRINTGGTFRPEGQTRFHAPQDLGARARHRVGRPRRGLFGETASPGVHLVGALGRGVQGPVADGDRSGARGQ